MSAFMQAETSTDMYARLPNEEWILRLHGAMYATRMARRDFAEFPAAILTECMGSLRGKLE